MSQQKHVLCAFSFINDSSMNKLICWCWLWMIYECGSWRTFDYSSKFISLSSSYICWILTKFSFNSQFYVTFIMLGRAVMPIGLGRFARVCRVWLRSVGQQFDRSTWPRASQQSTNSDRKQICRCRVGCEVSMQRKSKFDIKFPFLRAFSHFLTFSLWKENFFASLQFQIFISHTFFFLTNREFSRPFSP